MNVSLPLLATLLAVAPLAAQTRGAVLPAAVASPDHYVGNCPTKVEFVAHVTVTIPGTRLDYRWERSNGDSGKLMHAQVGLTGGSPRDSSHAPITAALPSDFWRLGLPGHSTQFWEVLHIESPVDIRSAPARVLVECRD